MFTVYVNNTVK